MMKCSKKAFAMCPTRHLCGSLDDATFAEESECAAFNNAVEDKPMTNADRIRAMSDEELRELFMFDTPCEMIVNSGNCLGSPCNCRECILIWLQQPAKPPEEASE